MNRVIFGPVASRRLGRSLGVDLVPFKFCNLSCVYCQLGPTTDLIVERAQYVETLNVIRQVEEFLQDSKRVENIDVISLAGSGEPTLAANCGKVIRMIKDITPVPVAVLTNGCLLWNDEVAEELTSADIVMPSVDAVSEEVFRKINRPHPSLNLSVILEGMEKFSRIYRGQLCPEVMVLEGVNDSDAEMSAIGKYLEKLKPRKVHLNTVRGPVAIAGIHSPPSHRMKQIASLFSPTLKVEIAGDYKSSHAGLPVLDEIGHVMEMTVSHLKRRPATASELSWSLEIDMSTVEMAIEQLISDGQILEVADRTDNYYTVRKVSL